jgi:hypothetical protein
MAVLLRVARWVNQPGSVCYPSRPRTIDAVIPELSLRERAHGRIEASMRPNP